MALIKVDTSTAKATAVRTAGSPNASIRAKLPLFERQNLSKSIFVPKTALLPTSRRLFAFASA
ncbi:hypothetical protein [Mesorhizobium sp. M0816]|uniref:hypothetical protein n=1 Tax=Mesorhizobium sp. M0816 TaxID=2957006 RepID=UPI00333B0076